MAVISVVIFYFFYVEHVHCFATENCNDISAWCRACIYIYIYRKCGCMLTLDASQLSVSSSFTTLNVCPFIFGILRELLQTQMMKPHTRYVVLVSEYNTIFKDPFILDQGRIFSSFFGLY